MYGYLNYILIRMGVLTEPFLWLQDVDSMLPIVIIVSLWMSMGAGFLTFLAGLQTMNEELYEAGRMDGIRNKFQEVWYLTLPLMKPQLLFGAVMAVVRSLEVAGVAVALTGLPSPLYATHTIMTHLQDYAFIRFEMGYASAISVVLFVMMFSLSRFFMRVLSTKDEY
jgi:multiple sugar transport system permease protein